MQKAFQLCWLIGNIKDGYKVSKFAMELLKCYELASGQAVNLSKNCVLFGANVNEMDAQVLAECLGMNRVEYHNRLSWIASSHW